MRRVWTAVAVALVLVGSGGPASAEPPRAARAPVAAPQPRVFEATLQSRHVGKQTVVFVAPPDYDPEGTTRYPAVVVWAGKGESVRGNRAGAWGWVEMYGVVPAMAALHRGQLNADDFQGLIDEAVLAEYNRVLSTQPYRGLILVCPYPPHRFSERRRYESFVLEELIPYTRTHWRVFDEPRRWGVDGISLGGTLSFALGFGHPEAFGAIGGQQAAIGDSPNGVLAAIEAGGAVWRERRVNVASSARDPFLPSLTSFVGKIRGLGVEARFVVLPGAHDKRFVRGPGSIELLLFHDRALWGSGELPAVNADGAFAPAPASD